jgi:hypothetical protein
MRCSRYIREAEEFGDLREISANFGADRNSRTASSVISDEEDDDVLARLFRDRCVKIDIARRGLGY